MVKEIAKRKPLRAIFRDADYGSDSVKINVDQIFRLLSPSTRGPLDLAMKFRFKKVQASDPTIVEAVADCFEGQPPLDKRPALPH